MRSVHVAGEPQGQHCLPGMSSKEPIRQNFDGMHLNPDCIQPVLEEYGYKRVEGCWPATVQELSWDGRFSPTNKQWAARCYHSAG
jgi:hypothetical protein